ncbi:MAG TPA: DUF4258 domain-containing protein [Candidatus Nanoarchaeia archaeon]|nr:hypothetical protein [uncultured archaeon]
MVKLTEHAELRLKERNITRDQVAETVESPDLILPARGGRQIAIRKFDGRFLKIVFTKKESGIIVITAHWISKLKRTQ